MGEPDFGVEGVDLSGAFIINDGDNVIDTVRQAVVTGDFKEFDFVVLDDAGNEYFLECLAFISFERFGKRRLYLALKDLEEEANSWHVYYVVQNADTYLLIHEDNSEIHASVVGALNGLPSADEIKSQTTDGGKTKKGWAIALKIILFPFWLIWQFIKAVLSLFNIAVGDSSAVKSFKKGYSGDDSGVKEYTFINDAGCEQTVYSSNGREFYSSDGSFVGISDDGGKTIK